MTIIYASTLATIRNAMWESINSLLVDKDTTWFVSGDFNDIISLSDQIGGSQQYIRRCSQHINQISAAGLIDIGALGNRCTWRRKRLQVRLDRIYTNMTGRIVFPNAMVVNLPFRH